MEKIRRNKKGISLVYVIMTAAVLLILSSLLISVAARSTSLTGTSIDGRQTYLTAKSAIEYAKTRAYQDAQGGSLNDFSVGIGKDGNWTEMADQVPDGKNCYAECKGEGGGNEKITAKVKYKNSDKYQTLCYQFNLSFDSSPFDSINNYLAAGMRYGSNAQILNSNGSISGNLNISYPAVFGQTISTVSTTDQSFAAPEMYFLKTQTSFQDNSGDGSSITLDANIIYFNGPIKIGQDPEHSPIYLVNSEFNQLHKEVDGKELGIVWFDNTIITTPTASRKIRNGAYYFKSGMNLANFDDSSSSGVSDSDFNKGALKAMRLQQKVLYYQTNAGNIKSSEGEGGVGWTSQGKMNTNSSGNLSNTDDDVFIYLNQTESTKVSPGNFVNQGWENLHHNMTYSARNIAMQYVGRRDVPLTFPNSTMPNSTIPDSIITFQTNTFWLNGQNEDGSPEDNMNDDDIPVIKAIGQYSHFVLESPDGHSDVKLILPHGISVINGNSTYTLNPASIPGYDRNNPSTFTFFVTSGTDLLKLNDESLKKASGTGGFTITGGTYTDS